MFCEKLQNVCSVAANPDQMDNNGCNFWAQRPRKPQICYKLHVPKNLVLIHFSSERRDLL